MSYQAIARKWRPRTFAEIAGQDHVKRTLQNALRMGRIHHAFLFTGARGVGKTTAARALAACLNCEQGPAPEPCLECSMCKDVRAGTAPDVVEIDGASNNSVEDVRGLRESVHYAPNRGKYRVFIIDEVHMLSKAAFNALLKTLEEPPDHVVFIFATTEPRKIPDTVLSRVQRFDFKRIPPKIVADRLRMICETEGVSVSDKALRLIARAGEGSMRDSQSLLDQVIAFAGEEPADESVLEILGLVDRSALYQMLEGLVGGEPHKSLETIHHVYEHGHDLAQFTAELLELVRNAALVRLSPQARPWMDVPPEEVERLEQLCKGMPAPVFSHLFNALLEVQDQVARSPRPRMVLEMAVARLSSHRPVQPVDHLIERLERLERGLQAKGAIPQAPGNGVGAPRKRAVAAPAEEPPPAQKEPEPAQPEEADSAPPEETATLSTPEILDPPERYRSLLGDLAKNSGEFRDLVEYSVFLGFAEGQLRIGFDSPRALKHGRELVQQESLRKAADTWFPGLVRIQVESREAATGQTNKERRKEQATADQQALEQAVREDPLIQEICTQLGAEIEGVVPERLDP